VEYFGRANVLIDRHEYVFAKALEGSRITNIFRIGKYIIMELRDASKGFEEAKYLYLLTHLGMSGAYLINQEHKHQRIIFKLTNKKLVYKDMRYFGNLKLFDSEGLQRYIYSRKLGVDALTSSKYEIEMQLVKKVYEPKYKYQPIKKLLLDQTILSGLGNIYANEVLHAARIHPEQTPNDLTFIDMKHIANASHSIMNLSYEVGGSSIKDYSHTDGSSGGFSEYMQVYGRKGEKCNECGEGIIRVVKVDGRSSFYCPICQPLKEE